MAKAKPSERMRAPRGRSPVQNLLSVAQVAAIHNVVTQVVYRSRDGWSSLALRDVQNEPGILFATTVHVAFGGR